MAAGHEVLGRKQAALKGQSIKQAEVVRSGKVKRE